MYFKNVLVKRGDVYKKGGVVFAICCLSCREVLFVAESIDLTGYITNCLAEVGTAIQNVLPKLVHSHFKGSHEAATSEGIKYFMLAFFPLYVEHNKEARIARQIEFRDRFGTSVAKGGCNLDI